MDIFNIFNFRSVMNLSGGGSSVAELIRYLMNTTKVDSSSEAYVQNTGYGSSTYNLALHTGQACEFTSTQYVDVPIVHQLGSEEVTNGTFDTDTNWTKSVNFTISGGTLICDGLQTGNTYSTQSASYISIGETYQIEYEIVSITNGISRIGFGGGGGQLDNRDSSVGSHSIEITISSISDPSLYIGGDLDFDGVYDNVSIKQITTTNSHLTHFDYATNEYVSLGNSVDGGSSDNLELVTNGDFSDGLTGWTTIRGTSEVIADKAQITRTSDVSYGEIRQYPSMKSGKTYVVSSYFEYGDSVTSKQLQFLALGGSTELFTFTTEGQHEFVINCVSDVSRLEVRVYADIDTYNIVDNISVKEILPISTKYRMQLGTYSHAFTTTVPVTSADLTYLNAHPEAATAVAKGGTDSNLSFVTANVSNFFPFTEGTGATIYDIMDGTWSTTATLTNYASTQWTNAAQLTTGPQTARYKIDSTRRVTAMADAGTIEFHGQEKAVIPTQSNTADLSVTATPRVLAGNLLSGAATIDTTGMTVGVESTKTLTAEVISGEITIGDSFDGVISEFKETL
jgi:hypothetical protein